MSKLPVKYDIPYGNQVNFYGAVGMPYVIAFVYPYPLHGTPFVMKGPSKVIHRKIGEINFPALVHVTFWRNKECVLKNYKLINTGRVHLEHMFKKINLRRYGRPYAIVYEKGEILDQSDKVLIKGFRNVPRKWIREINPFLGGGD